jgi:hypothetical protein
MQLCQLLYKRVFRTHQATKAIFSSFLIYPLGMLYLVPLPSLNYSFCITYSKPNNETVEKPLVRKMFIKISHNRLKNCQNVAKMLCGTSITRRFSAFLSHFSKIIFEKRLFRQFQRLALANWAAGWTRFVHGTEVTQSHDKVNLAV